jgi:RNA polymerase sigma-70 factor (ECF subfamily)
VASLVALSSENLIKACLALDHEAAWVEFIRRFQPLIARIVGRTARRNWPQAPTHMLDDLIQETYLKLCADQSRLLRQFRSRRQDSLYGFLKVVAVSVVLDHVKSELAQKRDASQTESLSDESSLARSTTGNSGRLSADEMVALRQVDRIIGKFYAGDILVRNRAIFWFHYRDGMTAQEIASIPGIQLNTKGVESTLRRMTQLIQGHMVSS